MTTEERLVRKAKAGHKKAFGNLVKLYQDKILYLCYDLLGNYEDAGDVAQESFMKAYTKINTFGEKSRFSTWLYRIAVNGCTDLLRQKGRQAAYFPAVSAENYLVEEQEDPQFNDAPDAPLLELERRQQIDEALNVLANQQKTAVVLKYFQELNIVEIAEIMECTRDTVRVHLYRAMEKLRAVLKKSK